MINIYFHPPDSEPTDLDNFEWTIYVGQSVFYECECNVLSLCPIGVIYGNKLRC